MTTPLLCVDHSPAVGGATRVALSIIAAIDRSYGEPLVACNPGPVADTYRRAGCAVAEMELPLLTFTGGPTSTVRLLAHFAAASRALRHLADTARPLAIHAHGLASALYAGSAAHRFGIPLVWHVHEMYERRARMVPFVRLAASRARVVVCVSRAAHERLVALGVDGARCRVVLNAPAAPWSATPRPGPHPFTGFSPPLLAIGALTPLKGHAVLIAALPEVLRAHRSAGVAIVGAPLLPQDTNYRAELERTARALGIESRVRLMGFREDTADLLAQAALVVHPSLGEESFGLVPLEAMAAGRAVVATRVGGLPEVVVDGVTGLLVAPGDPAALSCAIRALLDDPVTRERMGHEGARIAQERFGAERMLAEMAGVFADVTGKWIVAGALSSQEPGRTRAGAT